MRKRVQIALAVLLVVITGVIAWQALCPHEGEPEYQGKRLSSWLLKADGRGALQRNRNADEAVRQAGTNAIPTLLRMLCVKDSPFQSKLMDLAKRQQIIKVEYTPASDWNRAAEHGFEVLGAQAQSAVPTLIEIINQKIPPTSQFNAITVLGLIGPSAREAVPSLLRYVTNANYDIQSFQAISALSAIDAEEAVPALLQWATNTDANVRLHAVFGLGWIHAKPDRSVPVLIKTLRDPLSDIQTKAVRALGEFGPKAKLAVPALLELLDSQDDYADRLITTDALKAICLEPAANLGLK